MCISTLAVASSNTKIFEFLNIVLARQINWVSPTLKTELANVISSYNYFSSFNTFSSNYTYFKANQIYSSVNSLTGSILVLIVPLKINGDCGIIPTFYLSNSKPIYLISIPSISIFPVFYISLSLNNACRRELLPAPVLPTHPIFWPAVISNEIFLRTNSVSSLYYSDTFLKFIIP